MISAMCGASIGARTLRATRPWVRRGGSAGGVLGVGAAVEAPAGRAFVGLARAGGDRLREPLGVAAGRADFVGERRAIDAAVGDAAAGRAGAHAALGLRCARRGGGAGDDVGERLDLAVRDPDHARVEGVRRAHVGGSEDLPPDDVEHRQRGRVDNAIVGAGLQVGHRAPAHVACHRPPGERGVRDLAGEHGYDHVGDRGRQCGTHEAPASAVGRELAAAVGLHARLLQQRAVERELKLDRILRLRELCVVLGDPGLGVLGVHDLVQRRAQAGEHAPALERAGQQLRARAEQRVGVEVDRAAREFDVRGVGEPGPDQRPHRVQALQDQCLVVRERLVDGVQAPALGARAAGTVTFAA